MDPLLNFAGKVIDQYGPGGFTTVAIIGILAWMINRSTKNNEKCEDRLEAIGREYKESMERIVDKFAKSLEEANKENISSHSQIITLLRKVG